MHRRTKLLDRLSLPIEPQQNHCVFCQRIHILGIDLYRPPKQFSRASTASNEPRFLSACAYPAFSARASRNSASALRFSPSVRSSTPRLFLASAYCGSRAIARLNSAYCQCLLRLLPIQQSQLVMHRRIGSIQPQRMFERHSLVAQCTRPIQCYGKAVVVSAIARCCRDRAPILRNRGVPLPLLQ
jgi:hypothetical protein